MLVQKGGRLKNYFLRYMFVNIEIALYYQDYYPYYLCKSL